MWNAEFRHRRGRLDRGYPAAALQIQAGEIAQPLPEGAMAVIARGIRFQRGDNTRDGIKIGVGSGECG
ncbi:hypothetical protein D3C75_958620 [compost metagenome]